MMASIKRLDNSLLKSTELMTKLSESKQYSERKDQKRFKQLTRLKKDADAMKANIADPERLAKDVRSEMDNSLLRLADKLVSADMKVEELQNKLDEKTREADAATKDSRMKDAIIQ